MSGIWIKSQDKKTIVYAKFLEICNLACSDGSKCSECEIITRNDGNYITLGTYSTKEKALKVLNMIEPIIKGNYIWECIFKLPADDEVEV